VSFNAPVATTHKQRPPKTIMRLPFVFSVVIQAIVQLLFLSGSIAYLQLSKWFLSYSLDYPTKVLDLQNDYLFIFSNFQQLAIALAFNFNCKYSRPLRNGLFILFFLVLLTCNMIILFPIRGDNSALNAIQKAIWYNLFRMTTTDDTAPRYAQDYLVHRWITIAIIVANFLVALIAEFIVQRCLALYSRSYLRYNRSNLIYRNLIQTIPSMSKWI
jgi:magnesium-transporting ATPase (P-type)